MWVAQPAETGTLGAYHPKILDSISSGRSDLSRGRDGGAKPLRN